MRWNRSRLGRTTELRRIMLLLAVVPALCQALCLAPPSPEGSRVAEAPAAPSCHEAAPAHGAGEGKGMGASQASHEDCCDPATRAPLAEPDVPPALALAFFALALVRREPKDGHRFGPKGPPPQTGPPLTLLHCQFTE